MTRRARSERQDVLDVVEKADPQRYAELIELRHLNPAQFRRELARTAQKYALHAPVGGSPVAGPTPGRASDPTPRVGPATAAAAPPPERLPAQAPDVAEPNKPRRGKKES